MHESVRDWVAGVVAAYGLAERSVVEVGSYDENGSVRDLFCGPYVGFDMRDGPGVDTVARADDLPCPDGCCEVLVCTEMLEHDPAPWLSMSEMGRVLAPGGMLLLTARGNGFPLHGYPDDYWRFMPSSYPVLLALAGCETIEVVSDPQAPGLFGLGRKL